jgi:hypothetical protein
MSLTFVDAQTSLMELLHRESSYLVPEMAEVRVIDEEGRRQFASLMRDTSSLRQVIVRDYFRDALARWQREAELSSLLAEKRTHPAYRQILGLGEEMIPLILKEIEIRPSFIFMALNDITGEDPIPNEHRGRLSLMVADWLAWGTEHGFRR